MQKTGKDLHKLVEYIERSTTGLGARIHIQSPARLIDKDTGRRREHDVLISVSAAHHVTLIAIECRDRSRNLGVPEVEAFAKKCEKTGVHRGVMVSGKGFTQTALKKAQALGIDCFSLHHAQSFDWLQLNQLAVTRRKVLQVDLALITETEVSGEFTTYGGSGRPLTHGEIMQIGRGLLDEAIKQQGDLPEGVASVVWTDPIMHVLNSAGDIVRVTTVKARIHYVTENEIVPMRFCTYGSNESASCPYEVAGADLSLGGGTGSILMVNDGEGTSVMWFWEPGTNDPK